MADEEHVSKLDPATIRAAAIEAAAHAAHRALELCQAARILNNAGAVEAIPGAVLGATRAIGEASQQLSIIAETL